jgi:hypothetical protein
MTQNSITREWKLYLLSHGYSTLNEDEFKKGMLDLESKLSDRISSLKGILWQGDGTVNSYITVNEYDDAVKMLEKQAQLSSFAVANFDAADVPGPQSLMDIPAEVRFVQPQDVTLSQFQSADPDQTQQQGITVHQYPEKEENPKISDKNPETNIDERMLGLVNLIEELKK